MPLPLLSIQNLSISFVGEQGINHAIKNISLNIYKGEIVAMVGESGSGKSVTSLSILKLLPTPPAQMEGGQILYSEDGASTIDLIGADNEVLRHIRGNKISIIFQEPMTSLNPVITCGKQVVETLMVHNKITRQEAKSQAIQWFEKVKLPNPELVYHRYPHQLSGGQKQRVMIAMAMCCKPDLLICDEPTTALDVTVQKSVLELIKELQKETGMGVIFITHDLGVVAQIADRAIIMYKGEIVEQGSVKEIFKIPVQPYTRALLACRPVNHKRGVRLPVVSDFLHPIKVDQQEYSIEKEQIKESSKQEILIRAEHISVWFPNKKNWIGQPQSFIKAVDDLSFEIYKNETLGIVGESGCGKTTLGRTLLQLIPTTNGSIFYKEKNLADTSSQQLRKLRQHLQIVFQDPYSSLNPRKKIGAAIEEPLMVHGIVKSSEARRQRVIELLLKVGLLPEHYNRYPHEFSGGQRQRIVIARALALNPSFIICDESVSALDVSVQAQVLNLLNDLKKEFGFTIVFISHDLSVVRYFSDRIMVMNKGKIEEFGQSDKIYEDPQTEYTKKLIEAIPA
ncbi:MAG TPA: ABC transporter ATP-binding protein [Niabella sp.]|nr:ABC transporter ATP-binding protein [Niabella sp.]HOZ97738.1 ABC transporter ATP-binding protein [Niabella sp.]HQW14053.1 ABC transporter ATP-binding protein [Niabella sp.]HQX19404.1 ABC transporter ATP-binding protein [Niabella sp.]HQX40243.1 ABC transporter ATP-binding protein [Niabella sp.]